MAESGLAGDLLDVFDEPDKVALDAEQALSRTVCRPLRSSKSRACMVEHQSIQRFQRFHESI